MAKMLWKILEHVLVFLFVHILKTVQLQRLFFTLLGFLCSLVREYIYITSHYYSLPEKLWRL